MIRQFVPQEVCLSCRGCCRFSAVDSVWVPCLLEEDIQELLDRDIPPALLSLNKKIRPVPNPQQEGFICAFFDIETNKCKIYDFRPFECQLYPFLINLRNNKVLLTVDLNCPYAKDKLNTPEFKQYSDYLIAYLNTPRQLRMLKDNPQVIQAYEEVSEIIEFKLDNEDA
ncbi:MAG: YkgJ family cysteine cluster protein [Candidatus Omnitrophica bacterium]|nr:YkgJ family cysteine cluster protein [Candidatus Omnitrophota bacterium]